MAETLEQVELAVDPERSHLSETGIYVRARDEAADAWVSADISHLDKISLLKWLRCRGERNVWAENVVGYMLGHGILDDGSDLNTYEGKNYRELWEYAEKLLAALKCIDGINDNPAVYNAAINEVIDEVLNRRKDDGKEGEADKPQ